MSQPRRIDIPTREIPHPVIIIGDFLKDLDDEHALIGAVGLMRRGLIDIKCVVANSYPSDVRARGAKGTLQQLGFPLIPVAAGYEQLNTTPACANPYETDVPYLAAIEDIECNIELRGTPLLVRTLQECADRSVILVLNSAMTDAYQLIQHDESLFCAKILHVAIMGGIRTSEGDENWFDRDEVTGYVNPNNAANNAFDMESAEGLYAALQRLNVPMLVTMRSLAYATQVPFRLYDALERTGHVVGQCLKRRQQPALQKLWQSACASAGSEERGQLPQDRTRTWFVTVFCGGEDPPIPDGAEGIWSHVHTFNLYDPANLYVAIPELYFHFFFDAIPIDRDGMHAVLGLSDLRCGVVDREAFVTFMQEIEVEALLEAVRA